MVATLTVYSGESKKGTPYTCVKVEYDGKYRLVFDDKLLLDVLKAENRENEKKSSK